MEKSPKMLENNTFSTVVDFNSLSERSGLILDGKYKVLKKIGKGGQATVYLVKKITEKVQYLALKLYEPEINPKLVLNEYKQASLASKCKYIVSALELQMEPFQIQNRNQENFSCP
jgi:hypothetical protein